MRIYYYFLGSRTLCSTFFETSAWRSGWRRGQTSRSGSRSRWGTCSRYRYSIHIFCLASNVHKNHLKPAPMGAQDHEEPELDVFRPGSESSQAKMPSKIQIEIWELGLFHFFYENNRRSRPSLFKNGTSCRHWTSTYPYSGQCTPQRIFWRSSLR